MPNTRVMVPLLQFKVRAALMDTSNGNRAMIIRFTLGPLGFAVIANLPQGGQGVKGERGPLCYVKLSVMPTEQWEDAEASKHSTE